jgi:hypothetical protein
MDHLVTYWGDPSQSHGRWCLTSHVLKHRMWGVTKLLSLTVSLGNEPIKCYVSWGNNQSTISSSNQCHLI